MAIMFNENNELVMNDVELNRKQSIPAWHHMNDQDVMVPCNRRALYNFIIGFSRVLWRVNEDPNATYEQKRCARIMLRMCTRQIDKDSSELFALSIYDPFTWVWDDTRPAD